MSNIDEVDLADQESIINYLSSKESRFNKAKVHSILSKAKLLKYTNCGNISASVEDFIEKVEGLLRTVKLTSSQEKELLKTLMNKLPVEFTGYGGVNSLKDKGWENWKNMRSGLLDLAEKMSELFFHTHLLRTYDVDESGKQRGILQAEMGYTLEEYEKKQYSQQPFAGKKDYEKREPENFQTQRPTYQQNTWQDKTGERKVFQKREAIQQSKKESDKMEKPVNTPPSQVQPRFQQNVNFNSNNAQGNQAFNNTKLQNSVAKQALVVEENPFRQRKSLEWILLSLK